jgi:hypothetical protein
MWTTGIATLFLLCGSAAPVFAFGMDGPLIPVLRDLVAGNITAYDNEDLDGSMKLIDTHSPDYESTKAALAEQFKDLDVKSELVSFEYIGHDDEFAYGRVKTKTTGQPGSGFVDNTVDALYIFHQESGTWKLWSEKILGISMP